jgi:hypothetical protein
MAKAKSTLQATHERLANYRFDTSHYIVLDASIRRDAQTGKLISRKTGLAKAKQKK